MNECSIGWRTFPTLTRTGSGSMDSPTAAKRRCVCRRCSTATRYPSVPATGTNTPGKMAGIERGDSFMFTYEHEAYEFNLGSTFNYSDMGALMAPKPFMVERGHRDGVGMDEWVAYEYAKLRRFYTLLGIPDRTEIEYFNGVHQINSEGTFEFLHKHLNWPER